MAQANDPFGSIDTSSIDTGGMALVPLEGDMPVEQSLDTGELTLVPLEGEATEVSASPVSEILTPDIEAISLIEDQARMDHIRENLGLEPSEEVASQSPDTASAEVAPEHEVEGELLDEHVQVRNVVVSAEERRAREEAAQRQEEASRKAWEDSAQGIRESRYVSDVMAAISSQHRDVSERMSEIRAKGGRVSSIIDDLRTESYARPVTLTPEYKKVATFAANKLVELINADFDKVAQAEKDRRRTIETAQS